MIEAGGKITCIRLDRDTKKAYREPAGSRYAAVSFKNSVRAA